MRFKDKVVIVTGSARGIGRAIALGFGKEGARVVVADIREAQGEETARMVTQAGGQGHFVFTDVSNKSNVDAMVQKASIPSARSMCWSIMPAFARFTIS